LALLGVGALHLVDHEDLSLSNRNRYVGARHDDPIPGSRKVELGKRLIQSIDPEIAVEIVPDGLLCRAGFNAVRTADVVFGCVDHDGVRFVLNELCLAYRKVLIDLASDAPEPGCYGGRVTVVTGNNGCLSCRDLLDQKEVRQLLSPASVIENERAAYGITHDALDEAGPSVVFLNGVIASLGVGEFSALITGTRTPYSHLEYRGHEGIVRRRKDEPMPDCYYCGATSGQGDAAGLDRYLKSEASDAATPGHRASTTV
ncbi:MAG: HesA/MoeB/ThiF family protein, partial [bacterium]